MSIEELKSEIESLKFDLQIKSDVAAEYERKCGLLTTEVSRLRDSDKQVRKDLMEAVDEAVRLSAEFSLLTDKNTQLIAKNTKLRVAWRKEIERVSGSPKRSSWVAVTDRLPTINGHGVLAYNDETKTVLGAVQYTTDKGDAYKGTDNTGEPVWVLWHPWNGDEPRMIIGPNDVTHWLPFSEIPDVDRDDSIQTTECEWFEDCDGWHSDCGKDWEFIYDGPEENSLSFCMFCSKPVTVEKEHEPLFGDPGFPKVNK